MPVPDSAAEGARHTGTAAAHRRFGHLRRCARSLSYLGMTFGWLFFVLALTPSLLPRSWLAQGLVSGCAAAVGYGLGVALSWAGRRIGVPHPSARLVRQAWYMLGVLALVTVPIISWLSAGWQNDIRRAMGEPGTGRYLYLGVFVIAAGVAAAIVGIVRLIRAVCLVLAARVRRHPPRFAAPLIATVVVVTLAVGLATGFAGQVLLRIADATFSAENNGNNPGVSRPASPLRSGSPSSLVPWDSLGRQGRAFVAGGPAVAEIEQLTGRHAAEPIRVYAGLASAPTLQGEANLVLRELKRTGAFRRALLAIATPTGSGFIDPDLADPLEYMYGGNTAIAAMQYSYLPSWISFLAQRPQARQSGRTLFNTIYAYWSALPASHRPRLVVFGESLGAFGAQAAFSGVADVTVPPAGHCSSGRPTTANCGVN